MSGPERLKIIRYDAAGVQLGTVDMELDSSDIEHIAARSLGLMHPNFDCALEALFAAEIEAASGGQYPD